MVDCQPIRARCFAGSRREDCLLDSFGGERAVVMVERVASSYVASDNPGLSGTVVVRDFSEKCAESFGDTTFGGELLVAKMDWLVWGRTDFAA